MSKMNKTIKWVLYALTILLFVIELALLATYLTTPIVYLVSFIVCTEKGINLTVIGMLKYVLYASAVAFILLTLYVLTGIKKKKDAGKLMKVDTDVIQ